MGVRTIVLAGFLAAVASPALVEAQVRVGVVGGYSILETTDSSLTHGPLEDEVTLGRSWLLGPVVDVRFTSHDTLAFEFVYGPYTNDVDRYCIYNISSNTCPPKLGLSVSRAFQYGMQYRRSFGRAPWRPFVGGGFGATRYSYGDAFGQDSTTSPMMSVAAGIESTGRAPARFELRAVFDDNHPLLERAGRLELQARVTVLLSGR
jgi:hypothetical protein